MLQCRLGDCKSKVKTEVQKQLPEKKGGCIKANRSKATQKDGILKPPSRELLKKESYETFLMSLRTLLKSFSS